MACSSNNNTHEINKNEEKFRGKYEFLVGVLPDANPIFLQDKCQEFYENEYEFQRFIIRCLRKKKYPRKKDYERGIELSKEKEFYKSNFKVEQFLKIIPNPEDYFAETNSKKLNRIKHYNPTELEYAYSFLKNYFPHLYTKNIIAAFQENSYDLLKTVNFLKKKDVQLKRKRSEYPLSGEEEVGVDLLREIAYIEHRTDILLHLKNEKLEKKRAIEEARKLKLLNTCECCFDDEVLPAETLACENGHKFCVLCTRKGCEVMLEQGKQEFPCLTNCDNFFNIDKLEVILQPKVFSNICKSEQLKQIKAAKLENLECCPHCNFAAVVTPDYKVFNCLNSDCMKDTCLLCRQPSHVPLRCEEIEIPEEVKARIHIEDKLTEALVRTCYKCGMKFMKEDGCNKMKCPCGATMCYVCKQPVKDYTHFNGDGGNNYNLCPLFSNTNKLHAKNVLQEAQNLRASIKKDNTVKLKIDPTENIEYHYKMKKRRKSSACGCRECNT